MYYIYYHDYTTIINILLLPSFYHSLGRLLMTLSLHAQVGDSSHRSTCYFTRF